MEQTRPLSAARLCKMSRQCRRRQSDAQEKRAPSFLRSFEKTKTLLASQGYEASDIKNTGQVITNSRPELANWSDIFTGDETSNGAHLDLSKIQMFFFTIIIAFSYCMLLGKMFFYSESGGFSAFPAFDESALALIGISHAGYLVNKATPRP